MEQKLKDGSMLLAEMITAEGQQIYVNDVHSLRPCWALLFSEAYNENIYVAYFSVSVLTL